jgi:microcystin-dependent protein
MAMPRPGDSGSPDHKPRRAIAAMQCAIAKARRPGYYGVLPETYRGVRAGGTMSNPYVGEIRMFGGNFAPAGWAFCNGQLLDIASFDTLFNLIGTTYGGDGQVTFGLPDLQGRIPIHQGQGPGISQNYLIGEKFGQESVTLTTQQVPIHNHALLASSSPGYLASPANAVPAKHRDHKAFLSAAPGAGTLHPQSVGAAGGSQPHENMPPYLCVSFIISLFGIFPSP